ncbi:MAG: retention module-containing protein, partial [Pseudomonas sp.]|uniref:retention module-containing protein n=1 Tax=Pseudomonas sp. TaxID=306 RepID=UPI003393E9AE
MAAVMGVVSQLVGEVFAVAADGSRRPLAAGDKVFAGEQLVTGANGAVALALSAGGELTLGRDSQMLLDPQALASAQPAESPAAATAAADAPAAAPSTQDLSDVEALQAAIAAGVDPTQVGEATAAGPGAGGAGGAAGGGHSFVLLDAVGASVDPEIGFPTEGLNGAPAFPDPEAALLQAPNTAPDALDDNSTGAADDALTTAEDTPLLIQPATLLGNDIDLDGDVLTIQSVQAAVNGTVSLGLDGSILFTPDPDFNGTGSFTYTVNDGNGGTDTATVTIGVTPVNDAPDAQDDNSTGAADDLLTTPEDTPLTISPLTLLVNDSDPEGDPLTIQSVQAAVNGTVTLGPDGNILFTPTPDFSGTASFTYTVNDGNGATDTATVTIVVLPVAEPPEPPPVPNTTSATDDALSTAEDTPLTISPATLLANDTDPEGNPQTIQSVQNAVNGSVSFAGGNIVFTPTADFSGVASFTYTLNDGQGATATATVFITVTPVNTPPEVNVDPGNEGGNDLVFEGSLANGSDAASNGEFATGSFTLSDADGLDDLQSVTINGVTVALGSLAGTVFAGANGNLTVTAYNPATGVASYSYELTSPTTDGPGVESETFSLSVSDGTASSVPASIVVEIVDDQPNAVDDGNAVAEGAVTAVTGNVLSNDLHANGQSGADTPTGFVAWSGTAASYGSFSDTGSGTYSYLLNNGSAAVQALDDGETLTETFTYSMRDADGDLASATLTITITGSNDGPEVSVDPGNEGGNDQVFEAGLAAGSDAASSSEFASGSFSLSDADGLDDLQSVTIN